MSIKTPSIEAQKALVDAAHAAGLVAVAHALAREDAIEILHAGVDGMTHTFCDKPVNQEVIDAYKKNNAYEFFSTLRYSCSFSMALFTSPQMVTDYISNRYCNPTLAAIGSLTEEGMEMQQRYASDPRVKPLLDTSQVENLQRCLCMAKDKGQAEFAYESVRQLKKAGIDIVA